MAYLGFFDVAVTKHGQFDESVAFQGQFDQVVIATTGGAPPPDFNAAWAGGTIMTGMTVSAGV